MRKGMGKKFEKRLSEKKKRGIKVYGGKRYFPSEGNDSLKEKRK